MAWQLCSNSLSSLRGRVSQSLGMSLCMGCREVMAVAAASRAMASKAAMAARSALS